MGERCTVNGTGAGVEQCLGGAPERRAGGAHVVDEQHMLVPEVSICREDPPGQPDPLGSGAPRLAAETVTAQDRQRWPPETPRHLCGEQRGCARAKAKAAQNTGGVG